MVTEKQQQQTTNGSLIEKKDKMQQRPVKKYRQKNKQTKKQKSHAPLCSRHIKLKSASGRTTNLGHAMY